MTGTIIIPARYAATRFPAKLLQDLCGKSVLQRTWEAASASCASRVVIATDHSVIAQLAHGFGAEVVLTNEQHHSGSDRVCEAATRLGLADDHLVVNLQGDEPLFSSKDISLLLESMQDNPQIAMASMMHPLEDQEQFNSPNCVKVVVNHCSQALYFSRAGIPYRRNQGASIAMLHQGIYGFRLALLQRFVALPICALEQLEGLEQLRALYYGIAIHMVLSREPAFPGIDTPGDLEYARKVLERQQ